MALSSQNRNGSHRLGEGPATPPEVEGRSDRLGGRLTAPLLTTGACFNCINNVL